MSSQYLIPRPTRQAPPYQAADVAQALGRMLALYLYPLLVRLDEQLDKRLVRTFLLTIQAMVTFRDRMHGLLLSTRVPVPSGSATCCIRPNGPLPCCMPSCGNAPPSAYGSWNSKG